MYPAIPLNNVYNAEKGISSDGIVPGENSNNGVVFGMTNGKTSRACIHKRLLRKFGVPAYVGTRYIVYIARSRGIHNLGGALVGLTVFRGCRTMARINSEVETEIATS